MATNNYGIEDIWSTATKHGQSTEADRFPDVHSQHGHIIQVFLEPLSHLFRCVDIHTENCLTQLQHIFLRYLRLKHDSLTSKVPESNPNGFKSAVATIPY